MVIKLVILGVAIEIVDWNGVYCPGFHRNTRNRSQINDRSSDALATATAMARVSGAIAAAVAGILIAVATSAAAGMPAAAFVRTEASITGWATATTT